MTESRLFVRMRPWPAHFGQGSLMIEPRPLQRGQVCWTAKMPWLIRTWPEPAQVSQVAGVCPRAAPEPPHSVHSLTVWKSISVDVPKTACSRSSESS